MKEIYPLSTFQMLSWGIVEMVSMSPFLWQCQNLCRLSLAFIIEWRVVPVSLDQLLTDFLTSSSICLSSSASASPALTIFSRNPVMGSRLCRTSWISSLQSEMAHSRLDRFHSIPKFPKRLV